MSTFLDTGSQSTLAKELMAVGLTRNEARVYLALLPHHQVGTSKIVRATGLHGQSVYDALRTLEEAGLVYYSVIRGRKKFSANSPSKLTVYAKERQRLAESVADRLGKIGGQKHLQDFEIYEGEAAFIAHEFDIIEDAEAGGYLDIIGGDAPRFYQHILGTELTQKYEAVRLKKRIPLRFIGSYEQRDFFQTDAARNLKLFDYRIIPKMKQGYVNTVIRPGSVTFNTYADPLLSYTVKNAAVAASYKQFFDSLWAMCTK